MKQRLLFLLVIISFLFSISSVQSYNGCQYNGTGDWNITDSDDCTNSSITITLNSNLTVYGNLTLTNITLRVNVSSTDQFGISVEPSGRLIMKGNGSSLSNITMGDNSTARYYFLSYGYLEIRNSTVSNCGSEQGITAGIAIMGNNSIVSNLTMSNTDMGLLMFNYNNTVGGTNTTIEYCNITGDKSAIVINKDVSNNLIYKNDLQSSNASTIFINGATSNNISYNTVKSARVNAIGLNYSNYNDIYYNTLNSNNLSGINSDHSDNNIIKHNNCNNNTQSGITLDSADNSLVENNTATNNTEHGIYIIAGSTNNTFDSNIMHLNNKSGFFISYSISNILLNNEIYNNSIGISLIGANYTSVTSDKFYNNSMDAINSTSSIGTNLTNVVFTDSLRNDTALFEGSTLQFINMTINTSLTHLNDTSIATISWFVDVTAQLNNGTGINGTNVSVYNNTAYVRSIFTNTTGNITRQVLEEYLLNSSEAYSYSSNYSVNLSKTGYEANSTSFNLTSSKNITLNMLISNGYACSANSLCAGKYCVHRICRSADYYCGDGYCDSGETYTNCATDCSPPSTRASGSSGSSPTTTGSQASAVSSAHVFDQITAGKSNTVSVANEEMAVTKVEFTTKQSLLDVKVSVNKLGSKPSGTGNPKNMAYQYFEIDAPKLSSSELSVATISFAVDAAWINENKIKKNTIKLERYSDDEWLSLTTILTSETGLRLTYRAATAGFSYFAITGEPEIIIKEENKTEENVTGITGSAVEKPEFGWSEIFNKDTLMIIGALIATIIILNAFRYAGYKKSLKKHKEKKE